MKINLMQQSDIISSYMTNVTSTAAKQTQPASVMPSTDDSLELSSGAKEYAQLVKEAREAMEASETQESTRADEIMRSINKGTYSVSDTEVAASILNSASMPLYG